MTKQKMIYDALGSPIPQHLDEVSGFYVANTNGTGDVTGVDFSKKKLLRDVLGSVIPQYYDVLEDKFKPVTSEGISGGSSQMIHTSTLYPTSNDGKDGDMWIKYKEV